MKHWAHLLPFEHYCHEQRAKKYISSSCIFSEQMLWLLLQVAPIRNERDLVVLLLLTFRDITAFKQLIDAEDTKSGNFRYSNYENIWAISTFRNYQSKRK